MSLSYESFGKYILLEKLAVGGMAEIYLARNTGASGVSKFVAIKRILPQFTEQTEFIDMFKDEAKIAINLAHANVVSISEFGLEKETFYLAMDYIEGRNLRQLLNKMKKSNLSFSVEQVLYIIKEVAAGLDHAHRCIDANTGKPLDIIHRDMSPQNVMLSFEGEVKIVDFGIAKAATQLETTRAGTLKGKFGYMSPEQAEGQQVDLRTDVFALGIVLWELLANDRLFVANNEVNTLRKIRDCQIPSLRKINPNIPPELERIVGKSLAKDRNLRYQTAAAFHRDLSRFLNRQFPDFSPQDFSVFVKTLFSAEILDSRKKMVEYARVNMGLSAPSAASENLDHTVVTATNLPTNTSPDTESEVESDEELNFGNQDLPQAKRQPIPSAPAPSPTMNAKAPPAPVVAPAPAPTPQAKAPPAPTISSSAGPAPKAAQTPLATKAPPREGWQQPSPAERASSTPGAGDDAVLNGRLQVDRSAFRNNANEGSFANRSVSRAPAGQQTSSARFMMTLVAFGLLAGGGAYYFSNPARAVETVRPLLVQYGLMPQAKTDSTTSASTSPSSLKAHESAVPAADMVDVTVTSTPSGAPIEIDGQPQGEVTPATIKLEKNRTVKLSIKLAGYLPSPYEERFKVENARAIDVKFKGDKKGFLNVMVKGEGQIYINDKLVASTSPARMIAVPADEDVRVIAFDPKTKASDQQVVTVSEGASKTIVLTPRAAAPLPVAQ